MKTGIPPDEDRLPGWHGATSFATGPLAAGCILLLFWIFIVASDRDKCLTYDEVAHAAAGYSYWRYGDYRLQPENGQLPQRAAGLLLAMDSPKLPAPEMQAWKDAEVWKLGDQWFFKSGSDIASLVLKGRMVCAMFAVALGAIVWAWSRSAFGNLAGIVSLLVYVLNPTVLANGALMTSDMAAACLFAASTWAIWAMLERPTAGRLFTSSLVLAALFLTKASAPLMAGVGALIAASRVWDGRPLNIAIGRFICKCTSRSALVMAIAAAVLAHVVIVVAVIWTAYGFRYSAFDNSWSSQGRFRIPWQYLLDKPEPMSLLGSLRLTDEQRAKTASILVESGATDPIWSNRMLDALASIRRDVLTPSQTEAFDGLLAHTSPEAWIQAVEFIRDHRLLPEAWIYGFADAFGRSQARPAFLNGHFSLRGWRIFFPYTFLVKTPLAVFGIIGLALAAVVMKRNAQLRNRALLPLLAFLLVYWWAAVTSHLNIGHRHLLPVYAPMFVFSGISASWLISIFPRDRKIDASRFGIPFRAAGWAMLCLLIWLGGDVIHFFPNYLAYFNGVVSPHEAYRHLVDSSLDWGQDLPAVRAYVNNLPVDESCYFSYFGTASPNYYNIRALGLYSIPGADWLERPDWKEISIASSDVSSALPQLRQGWEGYDLLLTKASDGVVPVILLKKPERLALASGTYIIGASMLQPVNFPPNGPWGRWNARYEKRYQELKSGVFPLLSRDNALRLSALGTRTSNEWESLLQQFEEYRFARLTSYLRSRDPDDEINYAILVYRLSESDIARALEGPPIDLGPDDGAGASPELEYTGYN
jgi:hypothetical protein